MKKQITLIVCFLFVKVFSQIENIQLPKGGIDFFDTKTKHYTIHVTANREVFFNKKRIRFWDQISSLILEEIRIPKFNAVGDIVIYADKKTDYYILQRIKDEIGKSWSGFIHYMSKGGKNKTCLSYYIRSSFLTEKDFKGYHDLYENDVILTKKENMVLNTEFKVPILKSYYKNNNRIILWQPEFLNFFFTEEVPKIEEYIKQVKYDAISIDSQEQFVHRKEYVDYTNNKKLDKLVKENDVLFLDISTTLTFGSYYKVMIQIQKKRHNQKKNSTLRKPLLIEVPYLYNEQLKEKGLDIFKQN